MRCCERIPVNRASEPDEFEKLFGPPKPLQKTDGEAEVDAGEYTRFMSRVGVKVERPAAGLKVTEPGLPPPLPPPAVSAGSKRGISLWLAIGIPALILIAFIALRLISRR